MGLVKTLKSAFKKMKERNWDTVYVLVDLHETCVHPTWSPELSTELYPKCKETLQLMTQHPNIKLILWSSSTPETNQAYKAFFKGFGVNFVAVNENPFEDSTPYADFKSKPYMSLILDDKAGFDPMRDWDDLYDYMVMISTLGIIQKHGLNQSYLFMDNLKIDRVYGY